jgi:hypothetical protein
MAIAAMIPMIATTIQQLDKGEPLLILQFVLLVCDIAPVSIARPVPSQLDRKSLNQLGMQAETERQILGG